MGEEIDAKKILYSFHSPNISIYGQHHKNVMKHQTFSRLGHYKHEEGCFAVQYKNVLVQQADTGLDIQSPKYILIFLLLLPPHHL